MDGKGRAIDNVTIERLWRTVKYEEIYLKEYASGTDLHQGLGSYFAFYGHQRKHSSLDRQTPAEVYRSGRSKRVGLSIEKIRVRGPKIGVHFRPTAGGKPKRQRRTQARGCPRSDRTGQPTHKFGLADPATLRAALAVVIEDITIYCTDGGSRKWKFQRGTLRRGDSLRLLASSTRRTRFRRHPFEPRFMSTSFRFDHPDDAIDAVAERLTPTPIRSDVREWNGRVLAQDVVADRDSPAADVSAMDGYAVRLSHLKAGVEIPVGGESQPGGPPPTITDDAVVRIFTGAIVPPGAQAVVRREDTIESAGTIRWRDAALETRSGENIRFAGENIRGGEVFLTAGTLLQSPQSAALENFGVTATRVHARVRTAVLTTGNELPTKTSGRVDELPPWKIRNSNLVAIRAILQSKSWSAPPSTLHAEDDSNALRDQLRQALRTSDVVILTGGVSMGDHDYVPEVVRESGAEIVFHKLPIRPGKPILAAISRDGKLILGLPGNPVSATMGFVRFGMPWLAKISGQTRWRSCPPWCVWNRPVTRHCRCIGCAVCG